MTAEQNAERRELKTERLRGILNKEYLAVLQFSVLCVLISPCWSAAPVSQLPGIVDADAWKRPHHTSTTTVVASPVTKTVPAHVPTGKVAELVQSLTRIPEDQLSEKGGAAAPIMDSLRAEDGPDYLKLKVLLGRADVRKSLNPGSKCLLAGLISPRWDAFSLSGNLWLGALQGTNPDFRTKARQRLVSFIQLAHIPVLINVLKTPGPNVLAYEVLQEVTGQNLDPNPKAWSSWWNKTHGKVDVVGHILNQSRIQLAQIQIKPIDAAMFWYLPGELTRSDVVYAKRSISEQNAIGQWRDWSNMDVKHYVEQWDLSKPQLDRIVHQPDMRVGDYLKTLVADPGMGDYASVLLAWRKDETALPLIQNAYTQTPTVGRALARGSLGDKAALQDLLTMIELHKAPIAFRMMDDTQTASAAKLPGLGVIPAEQAFELLTREHVGLTTATTAGEKKKALKKAQKWLADNFEKLTLDPAHGHYVIPQK